jgi:Zn-dependent protease
MSDWGFVFIAVIAAASMLLVFNWRRPVALTRTVVIHKPISDVWRSVDHIDGDLSWQQHLDLHEPGPDGESVTLSHSMKRDDGSKVGWVLQFRIIERVAGKLIRLHRTGIDGLKTDDRLLEFSIELEPRQDTTLVRLSEKWGPRSLTGFALAHMDAAQSLARLKSWCETANPEPKGRQGWVSFTISVASLMATAAAFSLLMGWEIGVIFVGLLVLHELGHLISFRMIGQPWGKIIFMPFLGGVAVSRVPHLRLADDAFCAIMGAGLSVIALVPAILVTMFDVGSDGFRHAAFIMAAIAGALNLLNLLPVFPLDGGRVLRAVLQSLLPGHVRSAMFFMAVAVAAAGVIYKNPILAAIAVVAFFQSTRLGPARGDIVLMNGTGALVMSVAYLALAAAHAAALLAFWPSLVI